MLHGALGVAGAKRSVMSLVSVSLGGVYDTKRNDGDEAERAGATLRIEADNVDKDGLVSTQDKTAGDTRNA